LSLEAVSSSAAIAASTAADITVFGMSPMPEIATANALISTITGIVVLSEGVTLIFLSQGEGVLAQPNLFSNRLRIA
jgi:adenine deaminase